MFSVQAACSAPFIMMSQNRQAERDRLQARADLDTDVKAELEIEDMLGQLERIEHSTGNGSRPLTLAKRAREPQSIDGLTPRETLSAPLAAARMQGDGPYLMRFERGRIAVSSQCLVPSKGLSSATG